MEADASITNMTDVSFAEFETKTNDGNANFDDYGQCQDKHEIGMTLDLSLGQKEQLFATDQTPTPTRLIKNCEEVGLFDDLNPFDYDFLKAAKINEVSGKPPETPTHVEAPATDGDSLHTPQVYPAETPTVSAAEPALRQNSSSLDAPVTQVEELLATSTLATASTPAAAAIGPPPLQLIQAPVISWVLPAQTVPINTTAVSKAVPKQVVRPFILPKPSSAGNTKASTAITEPSTTPAHEPSSASLTPTSQLPIKERLKAILNNSNNNKDNNRKPRNFPMPEPKAKAATKRNDDCMERRRAASSRYRDKMRNAHKQIMERNAQLQQENRKLKERVATLERALQQQCLSNNSNAVLVGNQIQLAPSSIHLVINVPKMIVPSSIAGPRLDPK